VRAAVLGRFLSAWFFGSCSTWKFIYLYCIFENNVDRCGFMRKRLYLLGNKVLFCLVTWGFFWVVLGRCYFYEDFVKRVGVSGFGIRGLYPMLCLQLSR
jgi:hypothetical protein